MTIAEILEKMIRYSNGNIHDIDHLVRVWTFAKTIGELEASTKGVRAFVLRVRSGKALFDHASDHRIQAGDIIAVMAKYEIHAARGDVIGPEVSDPELLDIAAQIEGEVAVLKLADPGSPTLVQDRDNKGALYVLMPMRV